MSSEEAQSSGQTITLDALNDFLSVLMDQGAGELDPVKVQFVQSIMVRSAGWPGKVTQKLYLKAYRNLLEIQTELQDARDKALLKADQLEYQFPEAANKIQNLIETNRFKELDCYASTLAQSQSSHRRHLKSLSALTKQLSDFSVVNEESNVSEDLHTQLQQQEQDILSSLSENVGTRLSGTPKELKSIKVLREFQAKQQIEDLLAQVIREKPENPGPINPHMLAIRSLTMMQEISPDYLSEFVSYLDSIWALEDV